MYVAANPKVVDCGSNEVCNHDTTQENQYELKSGVKLQIHKSETPQVECSHAKNASGHITCSRKPNMEKWKELIVKL